MTTTQETAKETITNSYFDINNVDGIEFISMIDSINEAFYTENIEATKTSWEDIYYKCERSKIITTIRNDIRTFMAEIDSLGREMFNNDYNKFEVESILDKLREFSWIFETIQAELKRITDNHTREKSLIEARETVKQKANNKYASEDIIRNELYKNPEYVKYDFLLKELNYFSLLLRVINKHITTIVFRMK